MNGRAGGGHAELFYPGEYRLYALLAESFLASLAALSKIAIIIAASAWLVRRGVFTDSHTRALTAVVVNLALPCLIFGNFMQNFDVATFPDWWKYPLVGAALSLGSLGLAWLTFWRDGEHRLTLCALSSFQNAGYLILPIGEVLFPEQFTRFSVILFLMLLSYMPLLWSVGKILISHTKGTRLSWGQMFTTPFYTAVLAIGLVFTGLDRFFPRLALGAVQLVGQSCVPLATVVLGMTMGALKVSRLPAAWDTARVIALKLVLIPALMFLALKYTGFSSSPLENAFWILEASSPPATALALQAIHYGGDEQLVCGELVITYLAALLAIPMFFSLAKILL
ncbi:AEC family transporter [Gemmatimonadota bacterium]